MPRISAETRLRLRRQALALVLAWAGVFGLTPTWGAEASRDQQLQWFEARVRPILVDRCGKCHGAIKQEAGLNLTTRAGMFKGSDGGPVITPGNPDDSALIQAVRHEGDIKMPPKDKLSDSEIDALSRWVADGAPWPEEIAADPYAAASSHWAYQPVAEPQPPTVQDTAWPRSPVDQFILATLEQKGLHPAPDADKYNLLRRLTIDLTGLVPRPEDIELFVQDESPQAFERVVDRLLSSAEFGERWGRHWLDVTYWADTTGVGRRVPLREAWRYRDYVIAAFNQDKPFDQFVREQIAGDQLPFTSAEQRVEQLVATGYLILGPWQLFATDKEQMRMDIVDLQIDAVGRTFLGLTLGCARCHDHKFDPIPAKDYYALAGIFRSTHTIKGKIDSWSGLNQAPLPEDPGQLRHDAEELELWEQRIAALKAEQQSIEAEQKRLNGLLDELKSRVVSDDPLIGEYDEPRADPAEIKKQLQDLAKKSTKLKARTAYTNYMKPSPPQAYAAEDDAFPEDSHIALRGNPHSLGDVVPRGTLQAIEFVPSPEIGSRGSGRKELADWITNPKNPLAARVFVNRIWYHLFGAGIVATIDNFGTRGEAPTHPELLDYLAGRLATNGWSTKRMIRELVLSRSYQMASEQNDAAESVDPDNKLLWRMNRRRLEAEVIRDTVLQISGRLDSTRGGPTLPLTEENVFTIAPFFLEDSAKLDDDLRYRRSVYMPIMRGSQVEALDVFNLFDFADPDQVVGARSSTMVPTQALFLMNSPFIKDESQRLAQRLLDDCRLDFEKRVDQVHLLALGRPAAPDDLAQAREFLSGLEASLASQSPIPDDPRRDAWSRYCHAIFASAEFLYRR
jgi:mono/diheme cytochrome c family protein